MSDTRKGLLTEEQQERAEKAIDAGKFEFADGMLINLVDNIGLQKAKELLIEKYPELDMNDIYPLLDGLFDMLVPPTE